MVSNEDRTSVSISKPARDQLETLANANQTSQAEYIDQLVKYAYTQGLMMKKDVLWYTDEEWNPEDDS